MKILIKANKMRLKYNNIKAQILTKNKKSIN